MIQRARRRGRSLVIFLFVAVGILLCSGAVPANADTADEDDITWSVRPAGSDGADGRSWVELELDPGERASENLEIRNFSSAEVAFRLDAADGYFTTTGRFNMLPANAESTAAGLWIDVDDTVIVPAGGSVIVPFEVAVPSDTAPGDYPAGVAASISSVEVDGAGNAINVDSRVGFRVMTRVTGVVESRIEAKVEAAYALSWNPFEPGTAIVDYTVINAGNTRLTITPTITISGPFGSVGSQISGETIAEIAPGETRSGSIPTQRVWPLGVLDITLDAVGTPIIPASSDVSNVTVSESVMRVAVPIPQLAALTALVLLVGWGMHDRRRRQRIMQAQLAEARELGRREAELNAVPSHPQNG